MNKKLLLLVLFFYTVIAGITSAQFVPPPANVDTVYIPGITMTGSNVDTIYIPVGSMKGGENAGSMESTINGDTLSNGVRANPDRVYALYEGQIYYQTEPLNVYNPTGTITIVGIPDTSNLSVNTKPIILIEPTNGVDVVINNAGVNVVYGSLKFENIHYQAMQTDGTVEEELFYCGTGWGTTRNVTGTRQELLPQSLTIDNCLFEFCNLDLFDCTNESGAIGGWPHGAKFRLTNSYFRNMFHADQWWGSRVFQCKHPIDTLWIENCTVTTGGLTFLQQNELTDFAYINHNTIVNNKKYWLLSGFHKNLIITNNIFINQNWTGQDTNEISSGEDPNKPYHSTIYLNSISAENGVMVQQKYYVGSDSTSYVSALNLDSLTVYVSNNIYYYDPALITGYYNNSNYTLNTSFGNGYTTTAIPSYLNWFDGPGPWIVNNIPCEWMNTETQSFFKNQAPPNGGFIEENTLTINPQTVTPGIADASVVNAMAVWNQNQFGDPRFPAQGNILKSKFIYGDYLPTTLPGLINGVPSDSITGWGPGVQIGITKFTDLTENFSQSANLSKIDHLPIGALIWDDAQLAAYNSGNDLTAVNLAYIAAGGKSIVTGIKEVGRTPGTYSLKQNYPNPFNPSTNISFSLEKASNVKLEVYNILGQKVATLVNNFMQPGNYTVQFSAKGGSTPGGNAGRLASGVYIYRIEAGEFVSSKKMIVLK